MNRREFVGVTLAGIGGFLFPQKLFAKLFDVPNYLSSEEVFEIIVKNPQYGVAVFLHQAKFSRRSGKSTTHCCKCLLKFVYGTSVSGTAFIFKDEINNLECWFDTCNIKAICVCPTNGPAPSRDFDPWVRYEHTGNDRWILAASAKQCQDGILTEKNKWMFL